VASRTEVTPPSGREQDGVVAVVQGGELAFDGRHGRVSIPAVFLACFTARSVWLWVNSRSSGVSAKVNVAV
jgi:hypothetical protein